MANVFSFFTSRTTPTHLPGVSMLLGSMVVMIAAVLARSSLKRTVPAVSAVPTPTA